jgi:hypothetical protein
MALGTQFGQLITQLRSEVGRSATVSVGAADIDELKTVLRRHYESIHQEYDWPHLRRKFDPIQLQAGQRYYDLPTHLDHDRIETTAVWYSNIPRSLTRGISFENYAVFNSDNNVRSEPALRYDIVYAGDVPQIEIWPVPASSAQRVQFFGFTKAKALVQESETVDIDDSVICLFAAAEILARTDMKDAALKKNWADARLAKLKGNAKVDSRRYRVGMGPDRRDTRFRAIVRVR